MALMPAADVDVVPLVRDDTMWAAVAEGTAPVLHSEFEVVGTVIGTERGFPGVEGMREFMVDWLAPWEAYRSEVERTIDCGERVVTVFRISGRREGSAHRIESRGAWIWTIRDGKVARIVGYADPDEALKAVGIHE